MSAPVASETRSPFSASSALLPRWAKSGGDQECAEFVAIQASGVRLVIWPGPANVRGG